MLAIDDTDLNRPREGRADNGLLARACDPFPPALGVTANVCSVKLATTVQSATILFVVYCVPFKVPPQVPPTEAV